MEVYRILCTVVLLIGLCTPCEGLFGSTSLQDYIDSFVDAAKYKLEGKLSLNDSTISQIWSYFKSKYNRVYSSIGLLEIKLFLKILLCFFDYRRRERTFSCIS